ncbi:hypothetical protein OAB00_04270, partial [Akkermansiaceae bacterium]|nr:hypothetical protein [Akkermansiaceae bacterium]
MIKAKLNSGDKIGDYQLIEVIGEDFKTRTWIANQISVNREVLLEHLRSNLLKKPEERELFLADVRSKASVDHHLIGSVLETDQIGEHMFYVRERLFGKTLEQMEEGNEMLLPTQAANMLMQIAEAFIYLEEIDKGNYPIKPSHIYVNENGVTRMVNMVYNKPNNQSSFDEKEILGKTLQSLLIDGVAGYTRMKSLCSIMQDRKREVPITWKQVKLI